MRAARRDVALHAQAVQVGVDHAPCAGVGGRGRDVLGGQPAFHIPAAPHGGVVLADQAHHLVAKQPAHVQIIRRLGPVADHHIHVALGQVRVVMRVSRQGQYLDGA